MTAKLISAFPCCGKSYTASKNPRYLDLESSHYTWLEYNGHKLRNPDFPNNYIEEINLYKDYYDVIFVSSHLSVRVALSAYNLSYYLVYPDNTPECFQEWKRRAYERGTQKLWDALLENCWSSLLRSCRSDTSPCKHIVLNKESYIDTILPEILC